MARGKKNVNVLRRCSFKTSKYIIIKREKILYARLQDYSGLFDLLVNVQGGSVPDTLARGGLQNKSEGL